MTSASASSARISTGTSSALATWKIAWSMPLVLRAKISGHVGDDEQDLSCRGAARRQPRRPRSSRPAPRPSSRTTARPAPSAGRSEARIAWRAGGAVATAAGTMWTSGLTRGRQRGDVADQQAGDERPGERSRRGRSRAGTGRASRAGRSRPVVGCGRAVAAPVVDGRGVRGRVGGRWSSRSASSSLGRRAVLVFVPSSSSCRGLRACRRGRRRGCRRSSAARSGEWDFCRRARALLSCGLPVAGGRRRADRDRDRRDATAAGGVGDLHGDVVLPGGVERHLRRGDGRVRRAAVEVPAVGRARCRSGRVTVALKVTVPPDRHRRLRRGRGDGEQRSLEHLDRDRRRLAVLRPCTWSRKS